MDEIRALMDEITDILAAMSKERRLRFLSNTRSRWISQGRSTVRPTLCAPILTVPPPRALWKRRRVL